jgi:hypothetical protein
MAESARLKISKGETKKLNLEAKLKRFSEEIWNKETLGVQISPRPPIQYTLILFV